MKTKPGSPYPLGATVEEGGTNFALYSENATHVELCLFDAEGRETRVPVRNKSYNIWHVHVGTVGHGQRYAYRVHGPWAPERGLRFNPSCLLLDPYAKCLSGVEDWSAGVFAHRVGSEDGDLERVDEPQSGAPKGIVVETNVDWEGETPLQIPFHESIIYEAHVKGLTKLHPEVPPHLQGTYSGIATEPVINYLKNLGITALELLPVHAHVDEKFLLDKGLTNYWGYSTIGYFAPDARYRSVDEVGYEVRGFKRMVKALHKAGIEVILDVVYNHTAEGNHLGPTLSFKGIDNPTYYRLVEDNPRFYFDFTGTGNSINAGHPAALQLIMDSLRYWVTEMHVDGFRFDLASTLARELYQVDQLAAFFMIIHQDPILSRVKLIAEPWDVGEGGYQVGRFPVRWAEWNGLYRDQIRSFWKGDGGLASALGYRLSGSSDLYQTSGRTPYASINFITCHDGFTLRDLVSYNEKHNEANGEENRDGNNDNRSWNCGAEGETSDPSILALRARQQRNMIATLLLSQGTPMLYGGDEIGHTQRGNNNAYCQDNEISWLSWDIDDEKKSLLAFTRKVIALRRSHPSLHRSKFFRGRSIRGTEYQDLMWFRHDGELMSDADWSNESTRSLAMFLAGEGLEECDAEGNVLRDDNLLLILNASAEDLDFVLPPNCGADGWELLIDTANDDAEERRGAAEKTPLMARSLKLFRASQEMQLK